MLVWAMSVGLCLPLIALQWRLIGVSSLGLLFLLLFIGIALFAGFAFGWLSSRKGRDLPAKRLFVGSISAGVVVGALQYSALFSELPFILFGSLAGVALGSLGAVLYLMVERGIPRNEDPRRDNRYQKFIGRQRYRYTTDDDLSLPPLDANGASQERFTESADSATRD